MLEALLYVPVEDKENEQPVPDSSTHPVQYCKSSQNLEQLVQDSSSQHVQYCQTSTLSQDSEKISGILNDIKIEMLKVGTPEFIAENNLLYEFAVIQWLTSCPKNHITTCCITVTGV